MSYHSPITTVRGIIPDWDTPLKRIDLGGKPIGVEGVKSTGPEAVDRVAGPRCSSTGASPRESTAFRALALNAAAVGIGRPVIWCLATGGAHAVEQLLRGLIGEIGTRMAGLGAGRVAGLRRDMLCRAISR